MGNVYKAENGGIINKDSKNITINQIWNTLQKETGFTMEEMAEQLKQLREKLWAEAKTDEERAEVGAIVEAETEAKKKNTPKVIEALKKAGKWTFDVATKIGATIVARIIASSLGL